MQFIIDADTGDSISGWLAPDNPNATPSFIVRAPDREAVRFASNVMREGIRDMGLHATGQVGFSIDAGLIPDLGTLREVEIAEADSEIVLYRRFLPGLHVGRKLYLFDATLMPERGMMGAIKRHFTLAYANFERHGLETAITLVTAPLPKSIFAGGRANYNRFSFWLNEKGFVRAALLREPFEELAERLLFLHLVAKSNSKEIYSKYLTGVAPLVEFARNLPFDDLSGLKKAFRDTAPDQREALASPMTRALGCEIGEFPRDVHVSRALDNLATMEAVGTRDRFDLFNTLLKAALGRDVLRGASPATYSSVRTLAAALRQLRVVEDLIAEDLRLYGFVSDAIETGWSLRC